METTSKTTGMTNQESKEMAQYILSILAKTDIFVFFSWGVSQKAVIDGGLRIKVNGNKHKGYVDVVYDLGSDTFIVKMLNSKKEVIETIDDVYFDNLQYVIDIRVEDTSKY